MIYPAYFFDLDGTLYRGEEIVPGASEVVTKLKSEGAKIVYATNNSALPVSEYLAKLRRMNFPAEASEVITSAVATAGYLVSEGISEVWVIGEPGLVHTLRDAGISVVNADKQGHVEADFWLSDALVVGICRDALSFSLIDAAMQVVRSGARFIATNTDSTFPLEGGRLSPGNGAVVAALQACTGVEPTVIGKPHPLMAQMALERLGLSPEQMLVVGDRLDTDIACGTAAGCPTLLVLTGVPSDTPTGVRTLPSVANLLD